MASPAGDPPIKNPSLVSLLPALHALVALLNVSRVPGAIIGGVAASLQGQARATEDIDALLRIDERMLDRFLGMASSQGFRPRIPNAVAFAKRSAVLLLEHAVSGVGVDLTISRLPFDSEAVERARLVVMEDLEFPLVTPEDLIIMKAVAHRPQDIQDIQAVVRANSGLDVGRIRTHVQAFARALDMPELWKDIARLLKSRKATASRKASKTRKGK